MLQQQVYEALEYYIFLATLDGELPTKKEELSNLIKTALNFGLLGKEHFQALERQLKESEEAVEASLDSDCFVYFS
ncbi:hypothetical protein EDD75_2210 [Thermodesulfitimonas autotrophica]|uniref:Uncharacterized protein n=1 Tax=Thermodesulfitimonas autotrophica TaxID=1894989 RepID=A0A3N5A8J7_9THEO|nr:hypothetical protein [Thermodesulfitimonas autotrophica]RPF41989.1 hypothetical protein EDD75_2210 [Thermodesulfitimonas autotrophica]